MKKMTTAGFILGVLMCSCKSPQEPTVLEQADGSITVRVDAPSNAGNKPIYLNLYEEGVNVYDPSVIPLESGNAVLDADGDGSAVLADTAIGGETYQIAGTIDVSGGAYVAPEAGDYVFRKTSGEVDGDITVALEETDLTVYQTIPGSSFNERDIGDHHVRIWQADYWDGATSLGWIGDVDNITFTFDGSGGAIGRVSRMYSESLAGPTRVDDVDSSMVDVDALITHTGGGTYFFCIYGWVMDGLGWNSSTVRHEFYVVETWTRNETDPLIGTLTVDGVEYNMHRYAFPDSPGYRFKAIRNTDQRLSGPINMKPFFEYWRDHGMDNLYLDEMSWAIELLTGNHEGSFYLWNVDIPTYK